MNKLQLDREHDYLMHERLGILCGDKAPTPEQLKIAKDEADKAIERLIAQEKPTNGNKQGTD